MIKEEVSGQGLLTRYWSSLGLWLNRYKDGEKVGECKEAYDEAPSPYAYEEIEGRYIYDTWNAEKIYSTDIIVIYNDLIYKSRVNDNSGNIPTPGSEFWKQIQL